MLRRTNGKVRGICNPCPVSLLSMDSRWGYMLPRPPVIPERIHWYYALRIQSPCQMMIGVYNHLLRKIFRFHYHSQKVIGSLGMVIVSNISFWNIFFSPSWWTSTSSPWAISFKWVGNYQLFAMFSGQCKKHPKRLRKLPIDGGELHNRGMLKNGLEFAFNLNINFPIFFFKMILAVTVSKIVGRQKAHGYAPSNDILYIIGVWEVAASLGYHYFG